MKITYNQMHRTDRCSQHSSVIWPVWLNGLVFVFEISGCGFKSRCRNLNFECCTCFKQRVPWHPGNYRLWIQSETHTWHDNNIQSNAPYRYVLTKQLNHLASLAKWFSVRFRAKWLWIQFPLLSLKFQMSNLFPARSFVAFR